MVNVIKGLWWPNISAFWKCILQIQKTHTSTIQYSQKQKSFLWRHVKTRTAEDRLINTTREGVVKLWTSHLIIFINAHECNSILESFLKVNKHSSSTSVFLKTTHSIQISLWLTLLPVSVFTECQQGGNTTIKYPSFSLTSPPSLSMKARRGTVSYWSWRD